MSRWSVRILACQALFLLFVGVEAQTDRLHGTAAESQAVSEMKGRLRKAMASGDVAACKREGENMARYRQAAAGLAVIDSDTAAVEQRLREAGRLFDSFRQIRDLSSQQAVEKAYGLIRAIAVKMAEDAVTEVTVTLVTAPVPGAGRIAVEVGKQSADFLGNFDDAGKLVNRARALQSLDAMSRYANDQMKSLRPAIREAEDTLQTLSECRVQFNTGILAVPGALDRSTGLDKLPREQLDQVLYCACRCSLGCRASSRYQPDPKFGGQPCLCEGFGAWRAALTPQCVKDCLTGMGLTAEATDIESFVEKRNQEGGGTSSTAWSGTWSTSYNKMYLKQEGSRVTGTYDYMNGKIDGTIQGQSLKGTWSQSNDTGGFEFRLAADGNSFQGTWGRGASQSGGGAWNGTLAAAPKPVTTTSGDGIGNVLKVREENRQGQGCDGVWKREPGTRVFKASWQCVGGPVSDTVEIESIAGDKIVLFRKGTKGKYFGTLSPDGKRITGGTNSWEPNWTWSATIED